MNNPTRLLLTLAVTATLLSPGNAEDLESFTEPYKQIAVSAAEVGVLSQVLVVEGDAVTQQQILARLDDSVLAASLEVARAAKDALGARRGAENELASKTDQLESFRQLRAQGNATQRELDRAESAQLQAEARLQAVREELEVRRLEYERVKAQIKQRRLSSPIDGYVIQIEKEIGEFVSPTDPIVLHVAQLDTLKSVFSFPMDETKGLKAGQTVKLRVGIERKICDGVIEFVSPVADAQSSTVRVKVRIPNPKQTIQSGAACSWDMKVVTPVERVSYGRAHPKR